MEPAAYIAENKRWTRFGWTLTFGALAASFILGVVIVATAHQTDPTINLWDSICRGFGIGTRTTAPGSNLPPLRVSSQVAWTPETLATIATGDIQHGSVVASNCAACHGMNGVSVSSVYPSLAGMQREVIFKQLDDFRNGKRPNGVMNAIAKALSSKDSADVAAYYGTVTGGLSMPSADDFESGRSLREHDVAMRLIFAGDPVRGIPPCGVCHGQGASMLGAPSLRGQRQTYIERELGAFAEGTRQNDINEVMRTVAAQLTADEMHAVSVLYGSNAPITKVDMVIKTLPASSAPASN